MTFIAFLGCDGSGKSAVISRVTAYFHDMDTAVVHGHWRPVAFASEKTGEKQATAEDPHGQKVRNPVSSVLKLGWLWLNWWIGWHRQLRVPGDGGIILYDRYHADLLVDPKRYRYGGPAWVAELASRWMPQPDLVLFLDAPPEVLLSRKQEVSEASLAKSRAAYLHLTKTHPRFRVIDASRSLDEVVTEVVTAIRILKQGGL